MSEVLKVNGLTKKYGNFIAVDNLDLTILSGQIFGVLGPNGSGKTTTLGMLLGVINPTEGSFSWFKKSEFENCRQNIGSILEHPIFYPELSAYKNLEVSAKIKGCSVDRIDIVLKRVGLFSRKNSLFNTYSLGMKQRLALASALLANPDVLVLDEPTNGLDPQGINQMRELILSIAKEGKTIIISSHLLDEIQKMCTHVAILKKGKLIKTGSIDDILSEKNKIEIKAESNIQNLEYILKQIPFIIEVEQKDDLFLLTCKNDITTTQLNTVLIEKGIILSHLSKYKLSLEKEFLNIIKA